LNSNTKTGLTSLENKNLKSLKESWEKINEISKHFEILREKTSLLESKTKG